MSTTTQERITFVDSASGVDTYRVISVPAPVQAGGNEQLERAIFAFMQARRALGVTRVNSTEIARALQLPQRLVEQAVKRMSDKGVRVL